MPGYVALLRGINVGGRNLIKMPALKACFEAGGFAEVATYIQSGNVLFTSPETRAFGGRSLRIVLAVIDLPLPDSPTSPSISPGAIVNETPSTA